MWVVMEGYSFVEGLGPGEGYNDVHLEFVGQGVWGLRLEF